MLGAANLQTESLIGIFRDILGEESIRADAEAFLHYGKDWLKDYQPNPSCILFPGSYAQVQEIARVCNERGVALVPSGGRTGLSGGATATQGEVILSLERLNKILSIDATSRLAVCEAGVITEALQIAAASNGLFFPIDFASKGSSQIGGNIATNAGGVRVIRWGNIRDWVIGLKVVTAAGDILTLNGELFKNQSGYDLRQLFIGSEGTLGIIVEATLKLTSPPKEVTRLFCAAGSIDAILQTMARSRTQFGAINMFEYLSEKSMQIVANSGDLMPPLLGAAPHYCLIEIETPNSAERQALEEYFCELIEEELLTDVIISASSKQADDLLAVRERLPEILSSRFTVHKNDISVPITSISEFCSRLQQLIPTLFPDFELAIFGHLGDGNLHLNLIKPEVMSPESFFAFCKKADHQIFALVREFSGSISAEHGVGLLKKDFLHYSRSAPEIELMRGLKNLLDPRGILNPGKIFDSSS